MSRKFALAVSMVLAFATASSAQDWPARPVTVIVSFAAGGPVDTIARVMASRLSEILGQQFVVENIGGAGGQTGAARAAKAPPDGYTVLLSGSAVLAQNPALYKRQAYNPVADFDHVTLHTDSARVLIVRKDFPANTLAEFVSYVAANPDKVTYGSPGVGSGGHVCTILLEAAMGTKLTHIPYRGAGPAMQDLIAGRLDFMAEQISTAVPQIRGGTVKAIATLGPEAAPGLEELPTIAGQPGMQGLDCSAWGAFSFPKGAPRQAIERLAKASSEAIDTPAVRERFKTIGVTVVAPDRRSPEYLTQFVQSEMERWAKPIKASGASVD